MSNLPLGAEDDSLAPYNIEEHTFKIYVAFKGLAWYEYYGYLDIEDATKAIKERILASLHTIGDIDVNDVDIEIW